MKVSYEEVFAKRFGLQRRAGDGNVVRLSVRAEGNAGQPLSFPLFIIEKGHHFRVPTLS